MDEEEGLLLPRGRARAAHAGQLVRRCSCWHSGAGSCYVDTTKTPVLIITVRSVSSQSSQIRQCCPSGHLKITYALPMLMPHGLESPLIQSIFESLSRQKGENI